MDRSDAPALTAVPFLDALRAAADGGTTSDFQPRRSLLGRYLAGDPSDVLLGFLDTHAARLSRTALREATAKLDPAARNRYRA